MGTYKFHRSTVLVSVEETRSIISELDQKGEKELGALVALLWLLGCRVSEGLKLSKSDFKMDSERLTVFLGILKRRSKKQSSVVKQNAHNLHIPLNAPFVQDLLIPFIQSKPEGLLWPIRRQKVERELHLVNPNISPHIFRKSRLTDFANKGATGPELKDWAGWTVLASADSYLDSAGKAAERISHLLG